MLELFFFQEFDVLGPMDL